MCGEHVQRTGWSTYGDGSSCLASLSLGAFDSNGTLEVLYDFGSDVGGFQFDISGLALEGAVDGAAGDAGLTVSFGSGTGNGDLSTVIGFSLTGDTIPAGSGVLTVLNFSDVVNNKVWSNCVFSLHFNSPKKLKLQQQTNL